MNSRILAAFVIIALAGSCTSAYRSGQTPDDVYYSPARETGGYVQANREPDRNAGSSDYYYEHPDDRYLRMMVRNRNRWSAFDNYSMMDWRYNSFSTPYAHYGYNSYYGMNNFYNPWGFSYFNSYWNWNNFYNPYYPGVIIINPKNNPQEYRKIRNFNLATYTNRNYYNGGNNGRLMVTRGTYDRYYSNPNNSSLNNSRPGSSNSNRRLFGGNNNNSGGSDRYYTPGSSRSNSSSERPSRTYSPAPTNQSSSPARSSSGSSSGGSSGGGVSRPGRGN